MLKLGPVTDFGTYRDYVPRFGELLGRRSDCAEIHLLHKDLANGSEDLAKFREAGAFMRAEGVPAFAIHTLDDVLNDVILHALADRSPAYAPFRPKKRSFEQARDLLTRQFEALSEAGDGYGRSVNAVVHQGIILPSKALASLSRAERETLRSTFFDAIDDIHERFFFRPGSASCRILLENSPPYRGMSTDEQHFTDQLLADLAFRLRDDEGIVMDVSHTFMDHEYLRSGADGVYGLDLAATEPRPGFRCDNGLEDVASAGARTEWIHLNDCTGLFGKNEGLAPIQDDTVVAWPSLLSVLEEIDAPMILEVRHVERDFDLFRLALDAIRQHRNDI